MVLGGDFRQIPPILRRVDDKAIKSFTLKGLPWWRSCHVHHHALTRNMRARGDHEYAGFLEELGNGTYECSTLDLNGNALHQRAVRLPASITAPLSWNAHNLLEWVYSGYKA
eukprot:11331211-Karenia_brevis.AAC.1